MTNMTLKGGHGGLYRHPTKRDGANYTVPVSTTKYLGKKRDKYRYAVVGNNSHQRVDNSLNVPD